MTPLETFLDGLEASMDGRGYSKEHDEARRLLEAAPTLLRALESIHLKLTFEHVSDWRAMRRELGQICVDAIAEVSRVGGGT